MLFLTTIQKEFIKKNYFNFYLQGCPVQYEKEWEEIKEASVNLSEEGFAVFFDKNGEVERIGREILANSFIREKKLTGILFEPVQYTLSFRVYENGNWVCGQPVGFDFCR